MTRDNWIWIGTVGYILLFIFGSVGLFLYRVKRHGTRAPVAFKLLRGPGESLRRRMAEFDEDLVFWLVGAAILPLIPPMVVSWLVPLLELKTRPDYWSLIVIAVMVTSFFVTLFVVGRRVYLQMVRYRNHKLGYLGEREVAEHMRPLLARGYQVFHDVPAEGAKKDFNLDHVAVGPAGVAVIEVKTRRKGTARPGFKDHVVVFDGQQLVWPWGEDRNGLAQAANEAEWLKRFIFDRTGLDTPVRAVLALPGWWVEVKARGPVAVVNSKSVASAVEGNGPRILSEKEIDLIARQLDTLCRDVED